MKAKIAQCYHKDVSAQLETSLQSDVEKTEQRKKTNFILKIPISDESVNINYMK